MGGAFAMRFVERIGDLNGVPEVDVVLTTDVVQDANVWMIERGDRARFAVEPLTKFWISGDAPAGP